MMCVLGCCKDKLVNKCKMVGAFITYSNYLADSYPTLALISSLLLLWKGLIHLNWHQRIYNEKDQWV